MYNYDKIEVYEGDVTGQWGLQSGRGFVIVHPDLDPDTSILFMGGSRENAQQIDIDDDIWISNFMNVACSSITVKTTTN